MNTMNTVEIQGMNVPASIHIPPDRDFCGYFLVLGIGKVSQVKLFPFGTIVADALNQFDKHEWQGCHVDRLVYLYYLKHNQGTAFTIDQWEDDSDEFDDCDDCYV